ncbi:hypothetical protein R3Q08_31210 [Rhodococcus erythropolis]|uniref:hypothetical protein n=1 Tax=Rhodococcus erythropolis TaxID=1833 RepID=UPI0029493D55|nr:hypothetical protein [Rhodococcus erythropolis]MDV6212730.1 hypothetical protein [Rhodococcus erythropolis]
MITWADPMDGMFARGGAIELGITLPWSLAQGIDTLTRRDASNPVLLAGAVAAVVEDLDTIVDSGYWQLPAAHHPAFVRHDIPELGYERYQHDPAWIKSCKVAGQNGEVVIPSLLTGGWFDIFCQGSLTIISICGPLGDLPRLSWDHGHTLITVDISGK